MPTEEWDPSPNFSSRDGRKIIAIVNHVTAGAFPGCLSWLQNPIAQASAHYIVTKTGRIIQLVKEGDKAWANGIVNKPNWSLYDGTNPNLYTLSIEHEGQSGEPLTEAQYQSSLFLHKELTLKYGIPIDTGHIIGHYRIDSVNRPNCPGSGFPWDRLFKDLGGGEVLADNPMLLLGSKGSEVARLQNLLNARGANLIVDGDFGPATKKAVINFQAANGLLVDGVVGSQTWAKLFVPIPVAPVTPAVMYRVILDDVQTMAIADHDKAIALVHGAVDTGAASIGVVQRNDGVEILSYVKPVVVVPNKDKLAIDHMQQAIKILEG